ILPGVHRTRAPTSRKLSLVGWGSERRRTTISGRRGGYWSGGDSVLGKSALSVASIVHRSSSTDISYGTYDDNMLWM
ncbi:hypothetical protein BX616_007918, partial [Lobosporangium transversale]